MCFQRDRLLFEVVEELGILQPEVESLRQRRHRIPTERARDITEAQRRFVLLLPAGNQFRVCLARVEREREELLADREDAADMDRVTARGFVHDQVEYRSQMAIEDRESGFDSAGETVGE